MSGFIDAMVQLVFGPPPQSRSIVDEWRSEDAVMCADYIESQHKRISKAKTLHIRALEAKVKRLKQRIAEEQERTAAAKQGAKVLEAELRKKIGEFDGAVVNLHLLRNSILEKQAAAVEFDCENCRYCERNGRPGCDRWRPDGNKSCGYGLPKLIDVPLNGVPELIKTEISP